MRYRFTRDGFEFEADSPHEICEALWHSMKFQFYGSLEEWLTANARILKNCTGKNFSTIGTEEHVFDLLQHGIIVPLEN